MNSIRYFSSSIGLVLADTLAWVLSIHLFNLAEVHLSNLIVLVGLWMGWFGLIQRRYGRRQTLSADLLDIFIGSCLVVPSVLWAVHYKSHQQSYLALVEFGMCLGFFIFMLRALARSILNKFGLWKVPSVIFGSGENAQQAALALSSESNMGYVVSAFIIPYGAQQKLSFKAEHLPWPITEVDFKNIHDYHCVIALEANQSELRDQLIRQLSQNNIQDISVIPAMRGVPLYGLATTQFFSHEVLMLHLRNQLARSGIRLLKRVFDLMGSLVLLLLLSPLFAFVAWKVSRDGGSVFFGHERVGQNGRKFKCYKFRSMVINAQSMLEELLANDPQARAEWLKDFKLKDDPRINPIGHFLRRTSIDELPQLWNVLIGEMSLVGPRPVVEAELERYGEDVCYYLITKPGMTGLWQVSGRNDVDYETRVYFDTWYVKNWSIWTDIIILFKTISVVTGRKGSY